ncbi:MAG TPA: GxxExxY protein [Candidatus Hydrogenedentes bacterium]|nr:GxxExxY protein [Candidatus Hydrogenedentota bacterium]
MADELTERIIGAAIEVHRLLGPGLLESIYEEALSHEMALRGIAHERQKTVDVFYKGIPIHGQRLDLVVEDSVVVELKSCAQVNPAVQAQILSYLRATGLHRGLLLNFGESRLVNGIRRFSL